MTHKPDPVSRPLLGWREWVSLPELGIAQIKAKVDTGARSSCLHAFDVRIEREAGEEWVHFVVHPLQGQTKPAVAVKARLLEYRTVRSSSGHTESRPVVETTASVGDRHWMIELTLTNRDEMGFRMLLGRSAV
ncbi:MAG: ATP-dependent zinc protease, partial [Pirellulaceae bacterium]|nr:ATP-dependent zinc protease [Pirellulaceae bacterium]